MSLSNELQREEDRHERYYLNLNVGEDGNLTIAHHEEIPKGTLMSILKDVFVQTGLSVDRLKEILNA